MAVNWNEIFDAVEACEYAPVPSDVLLLLDERNNVAGFETVDADDCNPDPQEYAGPDFYQSIPDAYWDWAFQLAEQEG